MTSSRSYKIGGKRPGLNQEGILTPSQLLISSLNPNSGLEGMLHLVVIQVELMVSFAVVAVCEGTLRGIIDNPK
jgi:hypothetical protein